MQPSISICVPTYRRSAFLREALVSCLGQGYANLQVLVGDDSNDPATRVLCEKLDERIQYVGNATRLGQAGNLNALLDRARGEYLMVLHDDDKLVGDALSSLVEALRNDADAMGAFGLQQIIDTKSAVDESASAALNVFCYRTAEFEGGRLSSMASALRQQFPNDGYLLRSECVRGVRFRRYEEAGDGCDFVFPLDIARAQGDRRFLFLNRVTCQYRVHPEQVSSNFVNYPVLAIVEAISPSELDDAAAAALVDSKDKFAKRAVRELLARGCRREARRIIFSESFRFRRKAIRNVAYLALSCLPTVAARAVLAPRAVGARRS